MPTRACCQLLTISFTVHSVTRSRFSISKGLSFVDSTEASNGSLAVHSGFYTEGDGVSCVFRKSKGKRGHALIMNIYGGFGRAPKADPPNPNPKSMISAWMLFSLRLRAAGMLHLEIL